MLSSLSTEERVAFEKFDQPIQDKRRDVKAGDSNEDRTPPIINVNNGQGEMPLGLNSNSPREKSQLEKALTPPNLNSSDMSIRSKATRRNKELSDWAEDSLKLWILKECKEGLKAN